MIKIACPNCDSFSSRPSFSRIKRQLRLLGKRLQNWTLSTACFCFCCLVFPFSHRKKKSIRTIVQRTGQPPRRRAFASHLFFSRLRCFSLARCFARFLSCLGSFTTRCSGIWARAPFPFFRGGAKTWHDRRMENEPTWSLDPDTNYNRAGDMIFLLLTLSRQRSYW